MLWLNPLSTTLGLTLILDRGQFSSILRAYIDGSTVAQIDHLDEAVKNVGLQRRRCRDSDKIIM